MKNLLYFLWTLPFIFLLACVGCKKEKSPSTTNIVLYNKPLSVIQANINGKWKLQYAKGGICATYKSNYSNGESLWEFTTDNKIKQTYNTKIFTDTTIVWIKDLGSFTKGDSTYIMRFYKNPGYIVDGIFNDTLKMHDAYIADAVFYFLTKRN